MPKQIIFDEEARRSLKMGVDVLAEALNVALGPRGRRHAGVVDLDNIDGHDPRDFWEPLYAKGGQLLLDPGERRITTGMLRIEPYRLMGGLVCFVTGGAQHFACFVNLRIGQVVRALEDIRIRK